MTNKQNICSISISILFRSLNKCTIVKPRCAIGIPLRTAAEIWAFSNGLAMVDHVVSQCSQQAPRVLVLTHDSMSTNDNHG